jgi:uncharacterized protein (DUF952 family)
MAAPVYKVLADAAYNAAKTEGRFLGTSDDLRDGFIHLSAAHQVAGTLAKHYGGQEDLLLLALDADKLGNALKWEESREGDLFPHLYAPLPLDAIISAEPLPLNDDNTHILPEGLTA